MNKSYTVGRPKIIWLDRVRVTWHDINPEIPNRQRILWLVCHNVKCPHQPFILDHRPITWCRLAASKVYAMVCIYAYLADISIASTYESRWFNYRGKRHRWRNNSETICALFGDAFRNTWWIGDSRMYFSSYLTISELHNISLSMHPDHIDRFCLCFASTGRKYIWSSHILTIDSLFPLSNN